MGMFKDKDVICFLGDSITANGLWMGEVYQFLRKKYKVKCYNCGVAGVNANNAQHYLHSRCLIYNPDYVVMMFGINDIKREFYADKYVGDPEAEVIKREAIETHKIAYERMVREIIEAGSKVILCVAVPYDDKNEKASVNLNCQIGMDELGEFVHDIAVKYGCMLVDFQNVMQPMLTERDIINVDRVHPTQEGYHIMAQIFLKDLNEVKECDFDTPFVWEEWNKERYDAEQELALVNLIEYVSLFKEGYIERISYEDRKKIAAQRYEMFEDKENLIAKAYEEYIQKIDQYNQYVGEVVRRTVF